jgi:Ferritin-like domain
MTNEILTLEAVDADGAIRELAAEAAGDTRAGFLAKAGLLGGGAFGLSAILGTGVAEAATKRDVSILNYALTLEYLEAAFYTRAEKGGRLSGQAAQFAHVVGAHERAHVKALKAALGSKAVKRPKFDFGDTTKTQKAFLATAVVLEATGVAAYAGQAPRVQSDKVLAAALGIHAVEARHASWALQLTGHRGAPAAFDAPLTMKQVLKAVGKTGFIKA